MFKRICLILLACLLCFSAASCAKEPMKENDSSSPKEESAAESTSALTTEPPEEPSSLYPWGSAPKTLKILAVGNSFSVDAMEYLYQIAKSAGVEEVILGNLYIGGCSLATHLQHAKADDGAYRYYKNTSGTWTNTKNVKFSTALTDEDWDVITLQQSSKTSGLSESYGQTLTELMDAVEQGKTNQNAKLFWHMTWAYQQDSTHSAFPNYDKSQTKMYQMITDTVKSCILTEPRFDGVIPNATSIQNARSSFVGDTLTRDGYHLNYTLGRYIAGLTYFAAITGADVASIAYAPSADVTPAVQAMAKDSVIDAMNAPYEVTASKHTEGKWSTADENFNRVVNAADCWESDRTLAQTVGVDLTKYTILEYDYLENAYYYSTKGSGVTYPSSGESTYRQYVCAAKIFTKAEIPEGSLIICDLGWQYRPELWVSLSTKASTRPAVTSAAITVLNADFWGENRYLAWNISSNPKTSISEFYAAAASHVRIYVPNSTASGT